MRSRIAKVECKALSRMTRSEMPRSRYVELANLRRAVAEILA